MSSVNFIPDDKIQKIAEAYALDACNFLGNHFKITLDWSDSSIQHIESVMDRFHQESANAKPTPEKVMQFAKLFGSYIGEVYRKNHGATWGLVEMEGQRFPGLKAQSSGTTFWPWARAHKRLVNGAEDNVWHYYSALITPS
jgi:hypothetical protein